MLAGFWFENLWVERALSSPYSYKSRAFLSLLESSVCLSSALQTSRLRMNGQIWDCNLGLSTFVGLYAYLVMVQSLVLLAKQLPYSQHLFIFISLLLMFHYYKPCSFQSLCLDLAYFYIDIAVVVLPWYETCSSHCSCLPLFLGQSFCSFPSPFTVSLHFLLYT